MRTHGTFQQVYAAAKDLYYDATDCPLDPVIRFDGDEWMLESGLDPSEDSILEVSLEQFDLYWAESYSDETYVPTSEDEKEFQEMYAAS